jgi:hypothetical protein
MGQACTQSLHPAFVHLGWSLVELRTALNITKRAHRMGRTASALDRKASTLLTRLKILFGITADGVSAVLKVLDVAEAKIHKTIG